MVSLDYFYTEPPNKQNDKCDSRDLVPYHADLCIRTFQPVSCQSNINHLPCANTAISTHKSLRQIPADPLHDPGPDYRLPGSMGSACPLLMRESPTMQLQEILNQP